MPTKPTNSNTPSKPETGSGSGRSTSSLPARPAAPIGHLSAAARHSSSRRPTHWHHDDASPRNPRPLAASGQRSTQAPNPSQTSLPVASLPTTTSSTRHEEVTLSTGMFKFDASPSLRLPTGQALLELVDKFSAGGGATGNVFASGASLPVSGGMPVVPTGTGMAPESYHAIVAQTKQDAQPKFVPVFAMDYEFLLFPKAASRMPPSSISCVDILQRRLQTETGLDRDGAFDLGDVSKWFVEQLKPSTGRKFKDALLVPLAPDKTVKLPTGNRADIDYSSPYVCLRPPRSKTSKGAFLGITGQVLQRSRSEAKEQLIGSASTEEATDTAVRRAQARGFFDKLDGILAALSGKLGTGELGPGSESLPVDADSEALRTPTSQSLRARRKYASQLH